MNKHITDLDPKLSRCKWITFTYTSKETTYMTKLLKYTNLKIAYRTNNSIELNLKPKVQTTNKYLASGIYKLTCADCGKPYVRGQRG
jgi:hypothetical protein